MKVNIPYRFSETETGAIQFQKWLQSTDFPTGHTLQDKEHSPWIFSVRLYYCRFPVDKVRTTVIQLHKNNLLGSLWGRQDLQMDSNSHLYTQYNLGMTPLKHHSCKILEDKDNYKALLCLVDSSTLQDIVQQVMEALPERSNILQYIADNLLPVTVFNIYFQCCLLRVELYWSERESESDIAWNGYIDFSVVCLHWVAMSSDKDQREFSLSLSHSLQYNSTLS